MAAHDTSGDYLNKIGRIPLLTHDEELILARSIQAWVVDRNSDNPCPRIARRGKRALDRMVKANLRLVVSASKKFFGRGQTATMMDLIQEGNLGLIKAAEKFDPSRGYKFSTYAYWWIRQGMHRMLAQNDRIIRLPTAAIDILANARYFASNYKVKHHCWPSIEQLAANSGIQPETMQNYLAHASGCISLEQPAASRKHDSTANCIGETIASDITNDPDQVEHEILAKNISRWTETLTDREFDVICRIYGFNEYEPKSLTAIGLELGVCREAIRQSKERAIRKIRLAMAASTAA